MEATGSLKIVVLGSSGVGKSKLIERYFDQRGYQLASFREVHCGAVVSSCAWMESEEEESTKTGHPAKTQCAKSLLETSTNEVRLEAEATHLKCGICVDFWDQCGAERYGNTSYPRQFLDGVHAAILVFDGSRKTTYRDLGNILDHFRCSSGAPVVLVCNKTDYDGRVAQRSYAFATKNDLDLFRCSAAIGSNVTLAFDAAIRLAGAFRQTQVDQLVLLVMKALQNQSLVQIRPLVVLIALFAL